MRNIYRVTADDGEYLHVPIASDTLRAGAILFVGVMCTISSIVWMTLCWKMVGWRIIDRYPHTVGRLPTLITTLTGGSFDRLKTLSANVGLNGFPTKTYVVLLILGILSPALSLLCGLIIVGTLSNADICLNDRCIHSTGFGHMPNTSTFELRDSFEGINEINPREAFDRVESYVPDGVVMSTLPGSRSSAVEYGVVSLPDDFRHVPALVIDGHDYKVVGYRSHVVIDANETYVMFENGSVWSNPGVYLVPELRTAMLGLNEYNAGLVVINTATPESNDDDSITHRHGSSGRSEFSALVSAKDQRLIDVVVDDISNLDDSPLNSVRRLERVVAAYRRMHISVTTSYTEHVATLRCKTVGAGRIVTISSTEYVRNYDAPNASDIADKSIELTSVTDITDIMGLLSSARSVSRRDMRGYNVLTAVALVVARSIKSVQPPVYIKKSTLDGISVPVVRVHKLGAALLFVIITMPIVISIAMKILRPKMMRNHLWSRRLEQSDVWIILSHQSGSIDKGIHPVDGRARRKLACLAGTDCDRTESSNVELHSPIRSRTESCIVDID